jgi:membrane protease YdiL (CAAX protease family)
MSLLTRAKTLLAALLLPLIHLSLLTLFVIASGLLGSRDRAVVWADGEPGALVAAGAALMSNEWFPEPRVAPAAGSGPIPPGCSKSAHQFSIGGLRAEENQAARALIENVVRDAGARVCDSNRYVINEAGASGSQGPVQSIAALLLDSALLPGAMVLAAFLGLGALLNVRLACPSCPSLPAQLATGASVGLAWLASVALVQVALGAPLPSEAFDVSALGVGLAFAILVTEPALEELVFRNWLQELSERAAGAGIAALLSALLSAAAQLPQTLAQGALALSLGATLALVFVRTRSLPGCIACNLVASGGWMLWQGP